MGRICQQLEDERPGEGEEERRARFETLLDLMQQVSWGGDGPPRVSSAILMTPMSPPQLQDLGHPPKELAGESVSVTRDPWGCGGPVWTPLDAWVPWLTFPPSPHSPPASTWTCRGRQVVSNAASCSAGGGRGVPTAPPAPVLCCQGWPLPCYRLIKALTRMRPRRPSRAGAAAIEERGWTQQHRLCRPAPWGCWGWLGGAWCVVGGIGTLGPGDTCPPPMSAIKMLATTLAPAWGN